MGACVSSLSRGEDSERNVILDRQAAKQAAGSEQIQCQNQDAQGSIIAVQRKQHARQARVAFSLHWQMTGSQCLNS